MYYGHLIHQVISYLILPLVQKFPLEICPISTDSKFYRPRYLGYLRLDFWLICTFWRIFGYIHLFLRLLSLLYFLPSLWGRTFTSLTVVPFFPKIFIRFPNILTPWLWILKVWPSFPHLLPPSPSSPITFYKTTLKNHEVF